MSDCIPCQMNSPKTLSSQNPTISPTATLDCGTSINTDGNCALNSDGTPIVTPTTSSNAACVDNGSGLKCPVNPICSPWDLTQNSDTCEVDGYIAEQLQVAGAVLNVYKLLGIHEQGKLIDLIGNGAPISNGSLFNFPASNAFTKYVTEWRSAQTGNNVVTESYLGYDFGPIRLSNGRVRYGIETSVKHDVSMIKIKQGCNSENRITQARIERSSDGLKWYGAAVINLPDCDGLVTIPFNKTVPSRFWRIRPLTFNGSVDDYWTVQALQLIDYEETNISNIQDRILLENRDRDYQTTIIPMKCYYNPIDVQANASKFGFFQTDVYTIQVSFGETVNSLGRPFVIGDILQLPSETQYSATMKPVLKYLEVTDVAWSTTSYTASWIPTMQRLLATPVMASQETQQIFGKLTEDQDSTGLVDIDDGNNQKYQDVSTFSQTSKALANDAVPERGQDNSSIAEISQEAVDYAKTNLPGLNMNKLNASKNAYSDDALPPNGLPFTVGDEFPVAPKNGDYHRLTYTQLSKNGKDIPPRLYRFSSRKKFWIYLTTDMRYAARKTKPKLQEFTDPQSVNELTIPFPTSTP